MEGQGTPDQSQAGPGEPTRDTAEKYSGFHIGEVIWCHVLRTNHLHCLAMHLPACTPSGLARSLSSVPLA